MPRPADSWRSPSPASQDPTPLTVSELSAHFSAYSLDGLSTCVEKRFEFDQDYGFGSTQQPIVFRQPDYTASSTSSSLNTPTTSQSEPPSPTSRSPYLSPMTSPAILPLAPYSSMSASRIRQQRQRAVRNMCTESHLRDISDLVARMVAEGDQCAVCETTSSSRNYSYSSTREPSLTRTASEDSAGPNYSINIMMSPGSLSEEPATLMDEFDSESAYSCYDRQRPSSSDGLEASKAASSISTSGFLSAQGGSRLGRLGTGHSIADLRAHRSLRSGISKSLSRSTSRRPAPTRRQAICIMGRR